MLGRDCFAGPLAVAGPLGRGGKQAGRGGAVAENSYGPKKERKKEIPFHFQKTFS
jgi:hypothetical protein